MDAGFVVYRTSFTHHPEGCYKTLRAQSVHIFRGWWKCHVLIKAVVSQVYSCSLNNMKFRDIESPPPDPCSQKSKYYCWSHQELWCAVNLMLFSCLLPQHEFWNPWIKESFWPQAVLFKKYIFKGYRLSLMDLCQVTWTLSRNWPF